MLIRQRPSQWSRQLCNECFSSERFLNALLVIYLFLHLRYRHLTSLCTRAVEEYFEEHGMTTWGLWEVLFWPFRDSLQNHTFPRSPPLPLPTLKIGKKEQCRWHLDLYLTGTLFLSIIFSLWAFSPLTRSALHRKTGKFRGRCRGMDTGRDPHIDLDSIPQISFSNMRLGGCS